MSNNISVDTLQSERTARAMHAIEKNAWKIHGQQDLFTVTTESNRTYQVNIFGNVPSCSCPDFTHFEGKIRCKHIEGVKIWQAQHPPISSHRTQKGKTTMNDDMADLIQQLNSPLNMSRVKRRKAPGGGTVPYLEGYDEIRRANQIFHFAWSFILTGQPTITKWERPKMYWDKQARRMMPEIDAKGNPVMETIGLAHITGEVRVKFPDETVIIHGDVGRCGFTGNSIEALDMAIAGAPTDCMKRCLRQFGEQFGNSLYNKDIVLNGR